MIKTDHRFTTTEAVPPRDPAAVPPWFNENVAESADVHAAEVRGARIAYRSWVRPALSSSSSCTAPTEMQGRVVDKCLQFFGGYGHMQECEVSRSL